MGCAGVHALLHGLPVGVSTSVLVQTFLFGELDKQAVAAADAQKSSALADCASCSAAQLTMCQAGSAPFNRPPYNSTGFCSGPDYSTMLRLRGCSCSVTGTQCAASSTGNPCLFYATRFGGSPIETPPFMTSDAFATHPTNLTSLFTWVTRLIVTDETGVAGTRGGGVSDVVDSRWGLYASSGGVDALGQAVPAVPNATVRAQALQSTAAAGSGFLGGFNPRIVERVRAAPGGAWCMLADMYVHTPDELCRTGKVPLFTEWISPNCTTMASAVAADAAITSAQNAVKAGIYREFKVSGVLVSIL